MKSKFISALLFGVMAVASTTTFVSCKDYDDDINNLQTQIDKLNTTVSSIQSEIDKGKIITSVTSTSNGVTITMSDGSTYTITNGTDGEDGSVLTIGSNGNWYIDGVDSGVAAKGEKGDKGDTGDAGEDGADGNNGTDGGYYVPESDGYFWYYTADGTKTTTKGPQWKTTDSGTTTTSKIYAVKDNDNLTLCGLTDANGNAIPDVTISLGGKLTSLVFAPTTYVNGVEAIKFATLTYKTWGTTLTGDKPADANTDYSIDNKTNIAEYFANPANVLTSSIEGLSYVSNTATETTRAAAETSPIDVAGFNVEDNANGVRVLNVTITKNKAFKKPATGFTIVALKASLPTGETVYSDWTRVEETTETPYIHNKEAVDASGKLDEGTTGVQHFYAYSKIYGSATASTVDSVAKSVADAAAPIKEVYYKNTIDLDSLVQVCDKKGTVYNAKSYGLAFSYNLMDFKVKNEGSTVDATNQKDFAVLTGSVLSSKAIDGTTNNRSAIGRTPVVQVVLTDTVNKQVVDVRYIKIKWVDETVNKVLDDTYAFTDEYDCGEEYADTILQAQMNKIYATVNLEKEEFHAAYTLQSGLYTTLEKAKLGGTPDATGMTITDLVDNTSSTQTHNLKWTVGNVTATAAEFAAGKKVVTAYAVYRNVSNNQSIIIFPLELTLTMPKMAYADGVNKTNYWTGAVRNINPTAETDELYGNATAGPGYVTTQIRGTVLSGYSLVDTELSTASTPASVQELVKFGTAKVIFDESRLSEVATATGTSVSDWSLSDTKLTLKYKGNYAATLGLGTGDNQYNFIQLEETPRVNEGVKTTAASKATEGALLLVGKKVPVKLVNEWCNFSTDLEKFDFFFMTPLTFTGSGNSVSISDVTAGGSSSATLGTLTVKENAMANKRTVWTSAASGTNATLVEWYGVKGVVYDETNAMTNLQLDGTVGTTCNVKLSSFKKSNGDPLYNVVVDKANNKVIFYNNSGDAIGNDFVIEIPVSVDTKWQKGLSTVIKVTIKAHITSAK